MNTKTAPESCPFCGAARKPRCGFVWFTCGTMTAPSDSNRRDQTQACATAERERLTRERDDLLARVKRLEEAGDRMEKLLPEGSICDKAVNAWREAKEAKL